MQSREGLLVRVYLKNGHVFHGAVRQWSKTDGIILVSPNREIIEIPFTTEIAATVYIEKQDGTLMKERPRQEIEEEAGEEAQDIAPKHNMGDLTSLVELYKMKSQSEREMARQKLRSPICTSGMVDYGNQLSILRAAKDDTGK
jgi:hypothetical protein